MDLDDEESEEEVWSDPEGEDDTDEADEVVLSRIITMAPLDVEPLAIALESLPTHSSLERSLISLIQEMHQLLGDADAHFADRAADIEAGIRLHFLEMAKNPGAVLLGILSSMSDEEQFKQIRKIIPLLNSRCQRVSQKIEQDKMIGRSSDV